jgi:hypothetical protein
MSINGDAHFASVDTVTPFSKTYRFTHQGIRRVWFLQLFGFPARKDSFTGVLRSTPALSPPQAFSVSEERACHPGTRPAMGGAGAELEVVNAQPGCQHRQHPSTNGLVRQHEHNATVGEKITQN